VGECDGVKRPEVGEWWETDNGLRVLFGCDVSIAMPLYEFPCVMFFKDVDGKIKNLSCSYKRVTESCVRHLKGCTGFDWVEPKNEPQKEYPQYWTTLDTPKSTTAFVIRTGPAEWGDFSWVNKDGSFNPAGNNVRWSSQGRKRLTFEETEGLLAENKPASVESTEDWVVFDGSLVDFPRYEVDQVKHEKDSDFMNAISGWYGKKKEWESQRDKYTIRCRRKHLPVAAPAAETPHPSDRMQRVELWAPARIASEGHDWPLRVSVGEPPAGQGSWVKLQWSGTGFYVEKEGAEAPTANRHKNTMVSIDSSGNYEVGK